jgi:branched-chain amino acid transport system ATP-binding protein
VRTLHRDDGMTILLVEQRVAEALDDCDRAYVLETGRVEREGRGQDLLRDPHVKAAYLGL